MVLEGSFGRMDGGGMDGGMDGWMDGWTDGMRKRRGNNEKKYLERR